ncbi:MAG: bifunctional glycosyltransferase/class I SAM-dependent methyltransferase [Candidatus Omnitrophica bacterium]|nr:bifunctional glycosyltransferase/class I SAM-dependent methyltransferase [Candidatus Omnitrophota bacterium]
MDISIVVFALNKTADISLLSDKIKEIFSSINCTYEIIPEGSAAYGSALKEAVKSARGKYIITMDADFSHNPYILKGLFLHREDAHILIASRYIKGGVADMPFLRRCLSAGLNRLLSSALSLPLKDVSCGFRLYDARIFHEIEFSEKDFSVLVEILVKAYMHGFSVGEIPFHFRYHPESPANRNVIQVGFNFLRTFFKMWRARNTIASADYDDRAFNSRIPLQRFWQRRKYKIICSFAGYPSRILDAGCGTSKVLGAFPQAVGMDIDFKKLRYNLSLGNALLNADVRNLCFKDGVFDVVICSEVIEHIQHQTQTFTELKRVLKKRGVLILATPDYSRASWLIIEWLYKRVVPGGYADEHISHYNRRDLTEMMRGLGFKLEVYQYIWSADLICKFVKAS